MSKSVRLEAQRASRSVIVTAEERWKLSGRMMPELPDLPNEHLILEMAARFGMIRNQITETLVLYPRNVDCILDDAQRSIVCAWLGIQEPTDEQRVKYVREQMVRSSNGGKVWEALLDGSKLKDRHAYHALRYKRLDEQVGRGLTQEKYRRLKNKDATSGSIGGAMLAHDVELADVSRDAIGMPGMDNLGGWNEEEPDLVGFAAGDLVLVAGSAGVGKTKICLAMAAMASSPMHGHRALYNQAEFDLPTFRTKYCKGVLSGDEDLYVADKRSISDIVNLMYAVKPRWMFMDSKDKILEATNQAGWLRCQSALRKASQDLGCTTFLISHLNSDGTVKGGTTPQHDVDVVLIARRMKECSSMFVVSCPEKNRSGQTGEDRKSSFMHIGRRIECCAAAPKPVIKGKTAIMPEKPSNPLLDEKMPLDSVEERRLEVVLDGLLVRIEKEGIESLTEDNRSELRQIAEWKEARATKPYQSMLKSKQKAREKAQNAAAKAADKDKKKSKDEDSE